MTPLFLIADRIVAILPQATTTGDEFRPYLYVLLAFAVARIVIGAWVFKIARQVSRPGPFEDDSTPGADGEQGHRAARAARCVHVGQPFHDPLTRPAFPNKYRAT